MYSYWLTLELCPSKESTFKVRNIVITGFDIFHLDQLTDLGGNFPGNNMS